MAIAPERFETPAFGHLNSAIQEGLTFADCMAYFARERDEVDLAFVAAAQDKAREGEIEVDDTAMTSRGDDEEGCYVQAWMWVPADGVL